MIHVSTLLLGSIFSGLFSGRFRFIGHLKVIDLYLYLIIRKINYLDQLDCFFFLLISVSDSFNISTEVFPPAIIHNLIAAGFVSLNFPASHSFCC